MLTIRQAEKNIYKVAKQATPSNWNAGLTWYALAHSFCQEQADFFATPLDKVVGVLALLSPNCSWEINKLATVDILNNRKTSRNVYPLNVTKAIKLLDGETFKQITTHKRYGHKVRSFYDNILHLDHSNSVTVDTHAIKAAFDLTTLTQKQVRWVFEGGGNKVLVEAYRYVAKHYNIIPHKLQATVWLVVKDSLERNTNGYF